MAYSKSPWRIAGLYGKRAVEIKNTEGNAVCLVLVGTVADDGIEPWPEGEANARLILRASELLAALKTLLPFVREEWSNSAEDASGYYEVAGRARALITKIEGDQ